ncbi:E3 ubiquitin-protein ligase synoviolin [Homalodisca vitripennis]|nr:E3 ubiquitin-protein ligase synoviolin [Homalodisca vitripennis]
MAKDPPILHTRGIHTRKQYNHYKNLEVIPSKKLPCNHIFHTACLRSWFQRQQTCPTCRLNILRTSGSPQPPRGPPARPQDPPRPPAQFPFTWPTQPPPPAQQGGEAGPTAGTSAGESSAPPPPPTNMPFFCPPFPFMPFNVPPPMPPADLAGLSPEQLRQMEEANREGVEARLRCLHNIQLLLDTSVLMMQQYTAAAAAAAAASQVSSNASASASTSASASANSGAAAASSSTVPDESSPAVNITPAAPSEPTPAAGSDPGSSSQDEASGSSSSESPRAPVAPELEEARRRRLAKFGQTITE